MRLNMTGSIFTTAGQNLKTRVSTYSFFRRASWQLHDWNTTPACRVPACIHIEAILQVANLKEKDKQLGEVAERVSGEIEVGEPRRVPPGFETAASAQAEAQNQPDTSVQLAEEALAAASQHSTAPSASLSQASTGLPKSPRQEIPQIGMDCWSAENVSLSFTQKSARMTIFRAHPTNHGHWRAADPALQSQQEADIHE